MDVARVARALDGYHAVRLAAKPPGWDLGVPWPIFVDSQLGYPPVTASLCGEVAPVLYLGSRRLTEPVDITAERPRLTLTDPSSARSTPSLAHHAATLALTAYDTAELLGALVANGDSRNGLVRERNTYRDLAAHAEASLDVPAVSEFIAKAEAAIAATAHPFIPPVLAHPRKVPIR